MKKVLSILVVLALFLSTIPLSLSAATIENGKIILDAEDITITTPTNCTVNGNEITSGANQFPQFNVELPGNYYITSITVTGTMTDVDGVETEFKYIPGENGIRLYSGDTQVQSYTSWASIFTEGQTRDYKMNVSEENFSSAIDMIRFIGYWNGIPAAGQLTLTIDKIEIDGVIAPEKIELTSADYSITSPNNCTVNGNKIISGANQYPQFYVKLPRGYHIKSVIVTGTMTDESGAETEFKYRPGENGIMLYSGNTQVQSYTSWASIFTEGQTRDYKMNVSDANYSSAVDMIRFIGHWTATPAAGQLTLTIDKIEIEGVVATEKYELTSDDYSIISPNNCTVNGNIITSVANQYPQFSVKLPESYYIKSITVAGTITDTQNNNITYTLVRDGGVTLYSGNELVQTFGKGDYTSVFSEATPGKEYAMNVSEEKYSSAVDTIRFTTNWNSLPAAGQLTLTIDKIEIVAFSAGISTIEMKDSEITLTRTNGNAIEGNTYTSNGAQSPQFIIKNPSPVYTNKVEFSITNGATYQLTLTGVALILEDGTNVSVLQNKYVPAGSSNSYTIDVPAEYLTKKITGVKLAGWYNNSAITSTTYGITINSYKLYNVLSSQLEGFVEKNSSPITFVDVAGAYKSLSYGDKMAIANYAQIVDYLPALNSASIQGETVQVTTSVPYISSAIVSENYYISEFGIIAASADDVSDTELTLETENIKNVYNSFAAGDDISSYATYQASIDVDSSISGKNIVVRSYVKYTDGTNTVVYYSKNNDASNNVVDGTFSITCPTIKVSIIGDPNGDGVIDARDLVRLKKIVAEIDIEFDFIGADCNADGEVNALDLGTLRTYLLTGSGLASAPFDGELVLNSSWSGLEDDSKDFVDPV